MILPGSLQADVSLDPTDAKLWVALRNMESGDPERESKGSWQIHLLIHRIAYAYRDTENPPWAARMELVLRVLHRLVLRARESNVHRRVGLRAAGLLAFAARVGYSDGALDMLLDALLLPDHDDGARCLHLHLCIDSECHYPVVRELLAPWDKSKILQVVTRRLARSDNAEEHGLLRYVKKHLQQRRE